MKKVKRVMAALLVCMVLTTSTVQHTQVDVQAVVGIDDVVWAGFATYVMVALAINGYDTSEMDSLHALVNEVKDFCTTAYDYLSWRLAQDDVSLTINGYSLSDFKDYCSSVGKTFKKSLEWAFPSGRMTTEMVETVNLIMDFCNNSTIGDTSVKITKKTIDVVWNILKATGIQQTVRSDIFADYVDDYGFISYKRPQEVCKSTGMSLDEFSSNFEPGYFYLCGYDTGNKRYFAIPLNPANAYVYGQTSRGYYRLVSYINPQSLCSYFLQYGKGEMTYAEIMDSGDNMFSGSVLSWEIGGTSIGGHGGKIVGTGTPTTELIEFPYWISNSTFKCRLSANFSDCYIMYPVDSHGFSKSIDLFYTHDGIIARNQCIKYSEVTDLGASSSALAGIKLGTDDELELDTLLLQEILNRLHLDASVSSDDIADMVASKNQALLDSITSVSSSTADVKEEVKKGNGFLASIDATASQIKDIISDIPGSIIDALSLAISVVGGDIVGVAAGIFDVVTDVAESTADLFDTIYRAVVAALKACFVLPADFFEEWKDIFIGMLQNKLSLEGYLAFISDIRDITASHMEDFKVTLFGTECTVLTFSWYYKNIGTINDLIRGFTYIVLVFFNINQAYKMLRGTSLMKVGVHQEGG